MKRWWLGWVARSGSFELQTPWWVSGETDDGFYTICAAVIAPDERAAKDIVIKAHDETKVAALAIEWRFAKERPADWSPFGERFPRADWMRWPD